MSGPETTKNIFEPAAVMLLVEGAKMGVPSQSVEAAANMSVAISLKRIADALDCSDEGGRPQGTVLWWLEMIASAANAGRS